MVAREYGRGASRIGGENYSEVAVHWPCSDMAVTGLGVLR